MSLPSLKKTVTICLSVCVFFGTGCVCAESDPAQPNAWFQQDRIRMSFGTFVTDYESNIRVSSDTLGTGTNLSFEDNLGLDESRTVFRLAGHYRFSAKHRLEFSYVDLSRDGDAITDFPIIINDTFYPKGSTLETEFDYKVFKLAYAYSFWQTEKVDLSISAGAFIFDVDLNIISNEGIEEGESGTAPSPMFGLNLNYRMNDRVRLIVGYEYFSIHKSDVEAELIDMIVALEFKPFSKIGFGIGYNDVSIFAEDSEANDEFEYEYDGYLAYVTFTF
jgi:hypothetical protein